PRARAVVAGRAVDVVAVAPPGQQLPRDRDGHLDDRLSVLLAGRERLVLAQLPARDGVLEDGARAPLVREKARAAVALEFGLIVHVLTAGDSAGNKKEQEQKNIVAPVARVRSPQSAVAAANRVPTDD